MTIKITTESKPYFGGLGDSCLLAWLAEAAKGTDHPIELWASGHRRFMLECLGIPIADSPDDALIPSGCYNIELADQGRKPRWEYVAEFLNITTGIKRPTATIPEELMDWARQERAKAGSPFVVLFPQTHWKPREWPQSSWLFLGLQLKAIGINPIFMTEHKDERYIHSPTMCYYGFPLGHTMAMIAVADVVVGNDSMPAHLAGTLGTKTIAIMGPTKPTVFSHLPDVHCLQAKNQPCVGCHFSAPFCMACDVGCSALYSVSVQDVVDAVKNKLEEN